MLKLICITSHVLLHEHIIYNNNVHLLRTSKCSYFNQFLEINIGLHGSREIRSIHQFGLLKKNWLNILVKYIYISQNNKIISTK